MQFCVCVVFCIHTFVVIFSDTLPFMVFCMGGFEGSATHLKSVRNVVDFLLILKSEIFQHFI